ncbi:MAG: glycosyltransferase family 2 protein [Alloprevotella sp.]|nr:glycosyltransferase family 2 protein [Alloprevotella sp.]
MKISVITINYNDRDGLAKTMESVLSQTARLGVDYEYIVVDGGSSDGSAEVMAQYADKLAYGVSEPDGGIFNAMNKGIKAASGDYLNFMNAGDYFAAPDVLERVVKKLDGKDFYIGHQQNLKPHAHLIKAPRRISACSLVVQPLPHQATFIRSVLLKARGYNEQFKVIADWEQMVVEFLVNNRTYEQLDFVVACFDTTGLSARAGHDGRYEEERQRMLRETFSPRIIEVLVGRSRFDAKVRYALDKPNLWQRDLKILRNLLKVMPRDLWHRLFKTSGDKAI